MFNTKKRELKYEIECLNAAISNLKNMLELATATSEELADKLAYMTETYPFMLGQVVYEVQLRSNKGRFTKTKASREHSTINEIVVDKKNYFNLVEKLNVNVFKQFADAEAYLNTVCID